MTSRIRVPLRAHDPAVAITAAEVPAWFSGEPQLGSSGAGWTQQQADLACLGEALERILSRALPGDASLESSWSQWPLEEPAVDPRRWVLFHPDQYQQEGFPLQPLTRDTACRWVCCRRAGGGEPAWVPEELVYLTPRPGESQRHIFGFSTGLSCGQVGMPVLLRGAQEVIERDALIGGWWGSYPIEQWPLESIREQLGSRVWRRVDRPNLSYRFYRIRTPLSDHVTMVSVAGADDEGWVFSVGSACRETRRASWLKSLLEAIQGRHCVRRLLGERGDQRSGECRIPTTFFEHATYYAARPQDLARTVLERAEPAPPEVPGQRPECLADLQAKLGPERPILFRNLTPPGIAPAAERWLVLRVVIPGLQPLHGDHRLPFLGGPLWQPRDCRDWANISPHPFA